MRVPMLARPASAVPAVLVLVVGIAGCGEGGRSTPTASPDAPTRTLESPATASPATASPEPTVASEEPTGAAGPPLAVREFPVPDGSRPHDVAPAADGGVWYTAQVAGALGHLDPASGETREIPLGVGSRPHGVIVGPDGAPWITDGGLDAIVRVDPATDVVTTFPLPRAAVGANLNTAAFDGDGVLWFTGQSGSYGRLDPSEGEVEVFDAPEGRGPYGIATTPSGDVWFVSLAGSYLARIDRETGEARIVEPPTPDQGARRVWSDSAGRLWVAEWEAAQVGRYDPTTDEWREWRLPGEREPQPYAVYVDDRDVVWLTDFGNDAIVRFDPVAEAFTSLAPPTRGAMIRQLLGRPGEVWGAGSGTDRLILVTTAP